MKLAMMHINLAALNMPVHTDVMNKKNEKEPNMIILIKIYKQLNIYVKNLLIIKNLIKLNII